MLAEISVSSCPEVVGSTKYVEDRWFSNHFDFITIIKEGT
jgi:hypothetical protein